jgi:hypothetical protein
MPEVLSPETRIGEGWKLNAGLRAFFVAEFGPRFRFGQALRDLFRDPAGRTLGDGLRLHAAEMAAPARPLAPQFQYNAHIRAYFAANPDGTLKEAIALWRARRAERDGLRFGPSED